MRPFVLQGGLYSCEREFRKVFEIVHVRTPIGSSPDRIGEIAALLEALTREQTDVSS